jgi:hypothetical protein
MDEVKKKILVGYCIAIGLAMLYVPWKTDFQSSTIRTTISQGYGFILSDRNDSIDFSRLFIEIVLITVAAGAVYLLRDSIFEGKSNKNTAEKSPIKTVYIENTAPALNKDGKIAGTVTQQPDGKTLIEVKPGSDYTSIMFSSCIMFSNFLSDQEKEIFANWGGLPINEWARCHREKFALALMHHFHDLKESDAPMPEEMKEAFNNLPINTLPKLDRPLTNEIRRIFNRQFAGLSNKV